MVLSFFTRRKKTEATPEKIEVAAIPPEEQARLDLSACVTNAEKYTMICKLGSRKLAKQLINTFSDVDLLADIAQSEPLDSGVKAEAKKRLRNIHQLQESDQAVRALRRLEKIILEAEMRGHSETWYESFPWLEKAENEWAIFAVTARDALDFPVVEKRYHDALAIFQRRLEEQNMVKVIRECREKMCTEAESLAMCHDELCLDAEEKMTALRIRWDVKDALPATFATRLSARFEAAAATLENKVTHYREMLEKRQVVMESMESLIAEAERAAAEEELPVKSKIAGLRHQYEEIVKPIRGFESQYRIRMDAALNQMESRIRDVEQQAEAERQKIRDAAEQLCVEMEKAVMEPLTAERIREIQADVHGWIDAFGALNLKSSNPVAQRFLKAERHYLNERRGVFAAEDQERWAHYAVKIKLCEKAERLLKSLSEPDADVRDTSSSLKNLRQDWKAIGPVPKSVSEEIWGRFDDVCQQVYNWLLEKFTAEDAVRSENLTVKTRICETLEKLITDPPAKMKDAQQQFSALIEEWKTVGPAPMSVNKEVIARFRAGLDAFSAYRTDFFKQMKSQFDAAKSLKKELIQEAESLVEKSWSEGFKTVQALRVRWKEAGFAGKDHDETLWQAFNKALDGFFAAQTANSANNLTAKSEICGIIEKTTETCDENTNLKKADDAVRDALNRWREIGPVSDADTEAVITRFKAALNRWHERRDTVFAVLNTRREDAQRQKEDLIVRAEEILKSELPPKDTAEKIKALQTEWKELPFTFRETEQSLRDQFSALCNGFFENRRVQFDKVMTERHENLDMKRRICLHLEQLADIASPKDSVPTDMNALAKELEYILSYNMTGDKPETREDMISQAIELQSQWREIGPVPREETEALFTRYRRACDAIFGNRRHD